MKGVSTIQKSKKQKTIRTGPFSQRVDIYFVFPLIFTLALLCFLVFYNYIFFYQENRMLFVFSGEYLSGFASKPGGLLEYAGNFLSQGYFNNNYGALLQASIFTLIAAVFLRINNVLSPGRSFSLFFAALASFILMLMQTNINYALHNNLGFLLTGVYFQSAISSGKKTNQVLVTALFPLFFYLAGGYSWIFLGMITVYAFFTKKPVFAIGFWIIAGFSLLFYKSVLFLQPWSEILYYPLPSTDFFINRSIIWLLLLFFIFYPGLLILISSLSKDYSRKITTGSVVVLTLLTIIIMWKTFSSDNVQLFRLEKMFFTRDWNGVIDYQEAHQNRNLVAQYYYNTALAEKGMLGNRMFSAPQDYGTMSVMIPWNSQISMSKLFRGVYFYYTIGLVNEAHRWAFESMVTEGFHPENIKLLIKTNLINGHYKIAEKYITVLKKTLHYKSLARKYESMLSNPELIRSDPELGEKIRYKPKDNFLITIRNPEANINSLLQSNPGNAKALDYKFACMMLEKDVDGIVNNISYLLNAGYAKIPVHIEEAALFYQAARGPLPDLTVMRISNESVSRFSDYIKLTNNMPVARLKDGAGIRKELKNTYWYYLDTK